MTAEAVTEWVLAGGLVAGVCATAVRAEHRAKLRALTRLRSRRAERAAVEASLDDPAFAPDAIREAVLAMLELAQQVWDDAERRSTPVGEQPIVSWATARRRQIGVGLRMKGKPKVDILRVINRRSETEDRAIVRVRLRVHRDPKASATEPGDGTLLAQRVVRLEERWTLARRRGSWRLASNSGDPVSEALLAAPSIPSPVEDEERLGEAGLRELAERDHAAETLDLDELIEREAPAPARLRELATLDDRFSSELIGATLHHILEAWESLTDGSQQPLERMASGRAVQALMYSRSGVGRRLIRDAELTRWEALEIEPSSRPPRLRARVELKAAMFEPARRSAEDVTRRRMRHALIWTLELVHRPGAGPTWRLIASQDA